jgi:hypothetical protein
MRGLSLEPAAPSWSASVYVTTAWKLPADGVLGNTKRVEIQSVSWSQPTSFLGLASPESRIRMIAIASAQCYHPGIRQTLRLRTRRSLNERATPSRR